MEFEMCSYGPALYAQLMSLLKQPRKVFSKLRLQVKLSFVKEIRSFKMGISGSNAFPGDGKFPSVPRFPRFPVPRFPRFPDSPFCRHPFLLSRTDSLVIENSSG